VKFGVQLPHFGTLASGEGTLALARRAEALGFDSVWVSDHIVYPGALAERFGSEFYEAITTLAFVGAHTRRIGLGTAVLILPYRNPLLLAKQLATLDALAGSRLTVGVGAGWLAQEFAALGAPFAERGAATDEFLRILTTLWREERPRFAGKFFQFDDILFGPRPRRPPTILVGGNSPRALRRAAELADGWLPIWHAATGRGFTPEALRARIAEMQELRTRAGRPPAAEVAGVMPLALVDRPPEGSPQPLVGTPAGVVDMLRRYREAGLAHVVLTPYYGLAPALLPKNLEEIDRLLTAFARDVRPRL
jgi:probable F420-dependent oxidoreductase